MIDELILLRGWTREDATTFVSRHVLQLLGAKREKDAPQTDTIAAQVKPIMQQFRTLYLARYGEEPKVGGQEYAHISKLLKDYGPQLVSARLNAFFEWDDAYVERLGRTLGVFYKQWNTLAAHVNNQRPKAPAAPNCRHTPRCPDAKTCSKKFLAEHRPSFIAPTSPPTTT